MSAQDWTDDFPFDLLTESEREFVMRHGPREIRRMAAHGRLFAGSRDSRGRCLPLRYAVAARIADVCKIGPRK